MAFIDLLRTFTNPQNSYGIMGLDDPEGYKRRAGPITLVPPMGVNDPSRYELSPLTENPTASLNTVPLPPLSAFGLPDEPSAPRQEHKGIFGIKGGLRDILGTIGDAFLVQSGNKPMYAPKREQEKLSDALQGFASNPLEAVKRLTEAGYGKEAASLYNDYMKQRVEEAKAQASIGLDLQKRLSEQDKGYQTIGAMAGALNENNWGNLLPLVQRVASARGIELPEAPPTFDPSYAETLKSLGINPYEQSRLSQMEREIGTNAEERRLARESLEAYRGAQVGLGEKRLGLSEKEFEWKKENPPQSRRKTSTPPIPPRSPKFRGDMLKYTGPDGASRIIISPDGKRWELKK